MEGRAQASLTAGNWLPRPGRQFSEPQSPFPEKGPVLHHPWSDPSDLWFLAQALCHSLHIRSGMTHHQPHPCLSQAGSGNEGQSSGASL